MSNKYVGMMASFATFAVGFFARPLGAVLFGHIGDRIGRKNALLTTLLLMGAATVGIGLLPTTSSIGILAPCLLVAFRLVQGIAVGGEWGGAVLIAGEHAPQGRRTFFASFAQLGSPAGLILSMLAFRAVASLDNAALMSWGWRVPFLASGILLAVGVFIRFGLSESPEFEKNRVQNLSARHPLLTVLREYKMPVALCIAANTIGIGGFYFTNTYMLAYTTQNLGLDRKSVLDCFLTVAVLQFLAQPIAAHVGEKMGSSKFLKTMALCAIVSPYPMFLLANSRNLVLVTLGVAIAVLCLGSFYSVIAGFVSGIFPASVRYSAISVSYQFCGAITGGLTPLAAAWIAHGFPGVWWPLAVFYSFLATLSFLGVTMLHASRRRGFNGWE